LTVNGCRAVIDFVDPTQRSYDVGGILHARPFKIRRLGHIGLVADDLNRSREFHVTRLGFQVTDELDLTSVPGLQGLGDLVDDPRVLFTTCGPDHHSLILMTDAMGRLAMGPHTPADVRITQIAWQVDSLREVVDAANHLHALGVRITHSGRDMPGSNWHVYFLDPDGHTLELFYGMEQIGWQRRSKPPHLHKQRRHALPPLPQPSEASEITDTCEAGDLISTDPHPDDTIPTTAYDVGGILLPRPFRVVALGPISLLVEDVDRAEAFYTDVLGFTTTEVATIAGHRCTFLRTGTEHHSLVLLDRRLAAKLNLSPPTTTATIGIRLATYSQLRAAITYLGDNGYRTIDPLPTGLHTGIDYAAHVIDPSGHCLQLYSSMEQLGWQGTPRPPELRPQVSTPWPEHLPPTADTNAPGGLLGPLG
jgi:catechol 2,3-dioxygenase-like lactoylglutathione lyase family enzyme